MRVTDKNSEKASPGPSPQRLPAVLCDFDETTAHQNVAQLLLKHFDGNVSRQQLLGQLRQDNLTFKEYQELSFRGIGAGLEELKALVKEKAELRSHFKDLWEYCQSKGMPLAIVTVGLDFYIDALLEREGLGAVPRYAVKTNFLPEGVQYEYPYPWDGSGASSAEECSGWGTCKCAILSRYRDQGHSIVYVGDGRSDFCPVSIADKVFARSHLAATCLQNGVPFTEFEDFSDVIRGLELFHAEFGSVGA